MSPVWTCPCVYFCWLKLSACHGKVSLTILYEWGAGHTAMRSLPVVFSRQPVITFILTLQMWLFSWHQVARHHADRQIHCILCCENYLFASHFDPVTPAPECHVTGMVLSPLPLPQHSHRTCCCSLLNWRSPHPPPPSFCHLLGSSLKNLFSDSIWHFWNLAFPGRVCQERVGTVLNQWLCLALATSIRCWIFRSRRRIYCHKPGLMTVMVVALRPPMSKTSPRQVSRQRKLPEQLSHTQ